MSASVYVMSSTTVLSTMPETDEEFGYWSVPRRSRIAVPWSGILSKIYLG